MYGVVTRVSFGLAAFPVRFSPPSCGFDSCLSVDPGILRDGRTEGAYNNHVLINISVVHPFLFSYISCFHLLFIVAECQLLLPSTSK
jgi:hypothetical protein